MTNSAPVAQLAFSTDLDIRRAQFEADCRAMCRYCADAEPDVAQWVVWDAEYQFTRGDPAGAFVHKHVGVEDMITYCRATPIRKAWEGQ